jgi:hypothetical protein
LKGRILSQGFDYTFSETAYARFLRGRKLVVDDAFNAMVNHVNWRKETRADDLTIDNDYKSEAEKRMAYIHGEDKLGRPVIYAYVQKHDKTNRDMKEMRNLVVHTIDRAVSQSNPELEQMVIAFDMTGFSMKCMDFELVKFLVDTLQVNYPEVNDRLFLQKQLNYFC